MLIIKSHKKRFLTIHRVTTKEFSTTNFNPGNVLLECLETAGASRAFQRLRSDASTFFKFHLQAFFFLIKDLWGMLTFWVSSILTVSKHPIEVVSKKIANWLSERATYGFWNSEFPCHRWLCDSFWHWNYSKSIKTPPAWCRKPEKKGSSDGTSTQKKSRRATELTLLPKIILEYHWK